MAKPLDDRIAAAMGNGARAATVAELIDELKAATAAAQLEHDHLDALSKSATASEEAAEQAADQVSKLARKIVRLKAKGEQLAGRHEQLLNSERRKRSLEDHAQAKATRDQLAADLAEQWPALTAQVIALLERIEASDEECERVNKALYGNEWLLSAEAMARDVPGNFYRPSGGPILRLTAMRIPNLSGAGLEEMAWPIDKMRRDAFEAGGRELARARAQREAEGVKRYVVTPPDDSKARIVVETRHGPRDVGTGSIVLMTSEQAREAKARRCTVRLAKDGEQFGQPVSATF